MAVAAVLASARPVRRRNGAIKSSDFDQILWGFFSWKNAISIFGQMSSGFQFMAKSVEVAVFSSRVQGK